MTNKKLAAGVTAVQGFRAAGVFCGIKKCKPDLALIESVYPATAAGVFTRNLVQAAPVLVSRSHIDNSIRGIVCNSGNANACCGQQGKADALRMAEITASVLGCRFDQVLVASTGVIGQQLPMDKVEKGIHMAAASLSETGGEDAARAIMTTDTVPKLVARQGVFAGSSKLFAVGGIAKGAGMICPNMATMLGFLTTDAMISKEMLQKCLHEVVDRSFNMISIDGDTSTNDMVLLLANGRAGNPVITTAGPDYQSFKQVLMEACIDLAKAIVADGEGTTKLIRVEIKGAPDFATGRTIARSVINSNLVKTAFFGEDANWGRIIAAMGYSGAQFNPDTVDIYLGDVAVMKQGAGLVFDEEAALEAIRGKEVDVVIDLHQGNETVQAWGSDLSYDYITINSSYRS